jgi:hypothetical protein
MTQPKIKKPPKHPKPPRVRPKVGLAQAKEDKKLEISAGYLASQASNDPTNALAPQASALKAQRANLVALLGTHDTLMAQKDANDAAIVVAFAGHDQAIMSYANAAATFAAGDASVLSTLGVTAASSTKSPAKDDVGAPTLVIVAGLVDGDAVLKCKAVAHAGAYMFEYKLEPSLPTDPWLPSGALVTKHAQATVGGLPKGQAIRGRARAVGAAPGPWSDEVVGKAQ